MEIRNINVDETTVLDVTVYKDRAEVVRLLSFATNQIGALGLRVSNLTNSLNPESIRVKGIL